MPAKMSVEGGAEAARAFDKLASDIADMTATHEKIARARISGIATRTPVKTGDLRGSWDVEGSPDSGAILSSLDYAIPQEFGTRFMAPAAMIANTFAADEKQVEKEYEEAIRDAAKRRGFDVN